jgi:hypothetical protein
MLIVTEEILTLWMSYAVIEFDSMSKHMCFMDRSFGIGSYFSSPLYCTVQDMYEDCLKCENYSDTGIKELWESYIEHWSVL